MGPPGSPSKLASQHALFMTNLDQSPARNNSAVFERSTSPSRLNGGASGMVIDSLGEQVETLSKTNMQLSLQSKNLLTKLEDANEREITMIDAVTKLKELNAKGDIELAEKSETLKMEEGRLRDLKLKLQMEVERKGKLNSSMRNVDMEELKLDQNLAMQRAQCDALRQSQILYKEHYSREILQLKEIVEELSMEQESDLSLEGIDEELVDTMETRFAKLLQLTSEYNESLKEGSEGMISELNLESWVKLYDECKKRLAGYKVRIQEYEANNKNKNKNKSKDNIETEKDLVRSETLQRLEAGKLVDNIQAKMTKLRKPSTHNNGSNSNSTDKRRSFYGISGILPKDASVSPKLTSSATMLPGVKRTSSTRKPSAHVNQHPYSHITGVNHQSRTRE